MKKIGILTFHFCDNYGAVLQCYALKTYIKRTFNHDVEVINFFPEHTQKWYTETDLQERYLEKLNKFERFEKEILNIVSGRISNKEELKKLNYDCYIVGSDQIWNLSFPHSDTAYLLDFVEDSSIKISYAASVGMRLDDKILDHSIFKKYIPNFDYISVREKTHQPYIQSFTDKQVHTVLDPTLLLDSRDYDLIINNNKPTRGKYIFMYFLKHDNDFPQAMSFVNMLARKYNLKVLHFFVDLPNVVFENESQSYYFDGPTEFLWYIKNAEIIVTNSFHGTIFSIQYKKPFYTYVVKHMGARVVDLLKTLELEERIISGYKRLDEVIFEIDYTHAYDVIESLRIESKEFLEKSLSKVKEK